MTVESSLCHDGDQHRSMQHRQRIPLHESGLMQIIGSAVAAAVAGEDGTLSLAFTNGHRLSIFDDSSDYESYRLQIGDHEIVV